MAHGDARKKKWRGNWLMEWVDSTLHTTTEHGISSITTADAHSPAASSRLTWRQCRFKWTCPFRRKTKSGFCACAITCQTYSTIEVFTPCDAHTRATCWLSQLPWPLTQEAHNSARCNTCAPFHYTGFVFTCINPQVVGGLMPSVEIRHDSPVRFRFQHLEKQTGV
jgi:hypothetical protein